MTIPVRRLIPLAGSFTILVAAVLSGLVDRTAAGGLLLVSALLGIVGELTVARTSMLEHALEAAQGDILVRGALRDLLVLAALVTAGTSESGTVRPAAMAVAALVVGRGLLSAVLGQIESMRAYAVTWRNLEVPGVVRLPALAPAVTRNLALAASLSSFVLMGAAGVTLLSLSIQSLYWGVWLACAVLVACLAVAAADLLRATRDTHPRNVVEKVAAALGDFSPEVVLYYSRPEPIGYIANVWMRTLEQLPQRTIVLTRESFNAELVDTDKLPVVSVEPATDVERIVPESIDLALYPSNVAQNGHLIRLLGIFDVFIGHGDSDKGGSATTLTRSFDEAWVSGPAARDRYHMAGVGLRDEQIREVGRPQLAEIQRTGSQDGDSGQGAWDYTVLYAPTREGFFTGWQYSSILTQGEHILAALLSVPGVRVLFKPHPGTGTDDPVYRAEVERLATLVAMSGVPHEVLSGADELYQAFNRSDLLVSDISSVITDFLASGKPYVVTNSSGLDTAAFRSEFPSAGGAYILSGDGSELLGFLADARSADSLREERARTAAYLLGDTTADPLERFKQAVADTIAIQRTLDTRVP